MGCIFRYFLGIWIFLILTTTISAIENINTYSISAFYIINENNSIYENINYSFSVLVNDTILIPLSKNFSNIIITNGTNELNYSIIEGEKSILNISNYGILNRLSLSYVSENEIFQKDNVNLFFATFNFKYPLSKMEVKIVLPEGHSIYKEEYSPKDAKITTDGKKIILSWSKTNLQKTITYSVSFTPPIQKEKQNTTIIYEIQSDIREAYDKIRLIIIGIPFLAFIIIIISILFILKLTKKAKEHLLTGFFEDEQKAIKFLQKNKVVWQNKLRKEFNFSRAKTTRIINKLESHGLIRKEKFGKTNKIHWIK